MRHLPIHGRASRNIRGGIIPVGREPMEPTRPKLPSEAVELYNKFIHGGMSRRAFVEGVQRLAIGGLAASTIIERLMPNYALGQQVSRTDDRIKTSYETVPSPKGNGSIKGYLVRPISADTRSETVTKLPGIIVVHENRGLNPHIEDIARRLALANFMTFAPDGLTSLGGFPGDDYKGGLLFNKIDRAKMSEDMLAAAQWLKARPDCTGKIGATGFCYGGGVGAVGDRSELVEMFRAVEGAGLGAVGEVRAVGQGGGAVGPGEVDGAVVDGFLARRQETGARHRGREP